MTPSRVLANRVIHHSLSYQPELTMTSEDVIIGGVRMISYLAGCQVCLVNNEE